MSIIDRSRRKRPGRKVYGEKYDSVSAWVDALAKPNNFGGAYTGRSSERKGDARWAGTNTYPEALQLLKDGWADGLEKIKKTSVTLTEQIIKVLEVPELQYDVTGQDLDIGRFVAGEPEDFVTVEPAEQETYPKVLHVVANISASAAVDADTIMLKGAAIVALVDALEMHGKRVIVDIVSTADGQNDAVEQHQTWVRIKESDGPVQLANLVMLIAHPSTLRRLMFREMEMNDADNDWKGRFGAGHGYGSPGDIDEADAGDIYSGCMYGNWTNEEAEAWVLAELAKQGIHVEGDTE